MFWITITFSSLIVFKLHNFMQCVWLYDYWSSPESRLKTHHESKRCTAVSSTAPHPRRLSFFLLETQVVQKGVCQHQPRRIPTQHSTNYIHFKCLSNHTFFISLKPSSLRSGHSVLFPWHLDFFYCTCVVLQATQLNWIVDIICDCNIYKFHKLPRQGTRIGKR